MSSVIYSLKNGVNRTNNPTIGGVFAYGSYTSAGVFTLFTDYEYEDGTAFTSEPFDTTKPLVWKGATRYPHLGFENLSPNSEITPQPFPSFGIYLHPFIVEGVRQDVGVRVTIPFSGNISIASIIQRADLECGDDIGYRIMKNGVAIQARQFIQPSSTTTTINVPQNTFIAGDIIDFIVDVGSQGNSYCDDVALEVTLNYQYEKIPTPTVTTNPILCSTTSINGTTAYVSEGTFASIYDGTTLLHLTAVVLNPVLLNGTFSFTGLDFTNSLGKSLSLKLEKSGDIASDSINFVVQDGGCIEVEPSKPVVAKITFCDKKYYQQREMIGTISSEVLEEISGDVVIFEHPYIYGNPIIATAVAGSNWSVLSDNFIEGRKYVAYFLNYYGDITSQVDIVSLGCELNYNIKSILEGSVDGITNGILRVYQTPYDIDIPIENGIIKNGKFYIKTSSILPNVEYVFVAIKIN